MIDEHIYTRKLTPELLNYVWNYISEERKQEAALWSNGDIITARVTLLTGTMYESGIEKDGDYVPVCIYGYEIYKQFIYYKFIPTAFMTDQLWKVASRRAFHFIRNNFRNPDFLCYRHAVWVSDKLPNSYRWAKFLGFTDVIKEHYIWWDEYSIYLLEKIGKYSKVITED